MAKVSGGSGTILVNNGSSWSSTWIDELYTQPKIKSLPDWRVEVRFIMGGVINVSNNYLRSLPDNIPADTTNLLCSHNFLTSLPDLPEGLELLDCSFNRLTELPTLPSTLRILRCHGNFLKDLPNLPESLETVEIEGNDDMLDELKALLKMRGVLYDGS